MKILLLSGMPEATLVVINGGDSDIYYIQEI
jgi:hypothetical protein